MDSLEQRLIVLEAERDILRLVARYCHGVDDRDLPVFLAVWDDAAVWDVGSHRFEGTDEIAAAVARQWEAVETMLHATSNSVIDVAAPDVARDRRDLDGAAHRVRLRRTHAGLW